MKAEQEKHNKYNWNTTSWICSWGHQPVLDITTNHKQAWLLTISVSVLNAARAALAILTKDCAAMHITQHISEKVTNSIWGCIISRMLSSTGSWLFMSILRVCISNKYQSLLHNCCAALITQPVLQRYGLKISEFHIFMKLCPFQHEFCNLGNFMWIRLGVYTNKSHTS